MVPHLNWKLDDDENWFAPIFFGYSLNIIHNGDDEDGFYNVELYDQHGNEVNGICGGETVELAKTSCLEWLEDELKKVTV